MVSACDAPSWSIILTPSTYRFDLRACACAHLWGSARPPPGSEIKTRGNHRWRRPSARRQVYAPLNSESVGLEPETPLAVGLRDWSQPALFRQTRAKDSPWRVASCGITIRVGGEGDRGRVAADAEPAGSCALERMLGRARPGLESTRPAVSPPPPSSRRCGAREIPCLGCVPVASLDHDCNLGDTAGRIPPNLPQPNLGEGKGRRATRPLITPEIHMTRQYKRAGAYIKREGEGGRGKRKGKGEGSGGHPSVEDRHRT